MVARQAADEGARDFHAHATEHLREGTASGLRQALLGFDQAIEAAITGYLRDGPGIADPRPEADKARRPRAQFWPKTKYLEVATCSEGDPLAGLVHRVNEEHEVRNELQHDGRWLVPARPAVEFLDDAAEKTIAFLVSYRPAAHGVSEGTMRYLLFATAVPAISAAIPTAPRPGRRALTPQQRWTSGEAYRVARLVDPDRTGIHVRRFSRAVEERQMELFVPLGHTDSDDLDGILFADDELFDHISPGVYAWRPGETPTNGALAGARLADELVKVAMVLDPDRSGLHYLHEMAPQLRVWGVVVRGPGSEATIRNAMLNDDRFESLGGGRYRLTDKVEPL